MKVTSPSTRAERLIEAQRILDAVTREGIDHEALLVRRDHFLRRRFEIEDALVDIDDRIDERRLEVQPRLRDRRLRLTEAQNERLLPLIDGEQRGISDDERRGDYDDDHAADKTELHWTPPGCWD